MSWDDSKSSGDIIRSSEYNNMVDDQKSRLKLASIDEGTGSDCTGTDGETNRVFTLSNTELTALVQVFVEGRLEPPSEITVTHNSTDSTVEFQRAIWNTDNIVVYSYA